MALLKALANIIRDKKGSAVMLLGLLFFFIIFIFSGYFMEYRILLSKRDMVHDALIGAELAVLGTMDREKLGYGIIEIPPVYGRVIFEEFFLDNLRNISAEDPVVQEFKIYNPQDLPAVCSQGKEIRETAVHAVVTVKVKRPFFKGLLGETVEFTIHKDSDDILK